MYCDVDSLVEISSSRDVYKARRCLLGIGILGGSIFTKHLTTIIRNLITPHNSLSERHLERT